MKTDRYCAKGREKYPERESIPWIKLKLYDNRSEKVTQVTIQAPATDLTESTILFSTIVPFKNYKG